MTRSRSILRWTLAALALGAVGAIVLPACVGTPLPDPPSLSADLVWLDVGPQVDTVRIVGRARAVHPAGSTLRITDPPLAGVLIATNADGSFGRIVPGRPGDTFYVELVLPSEDRFVGAFTAPATGAFTPVSPGLDGDGDGSPDAIDCAPSDPTMEGLRCAAACRVDSDCATGQTCVSGTCAGAPTCTPTGEICNGIDDDCNGIIDDGDPNGGVTCAPTGGRCTQGILICDPTGPACIEAPAARETCGNGIDDDCNGVIDDGC